MQRCYVANVYQYWVGRNAWHGTWSSLYSENEAFWFDMDGLVGHIERRRVQGSQFSIRELPALVFVAADSALVVVEPDSDRPFVGPYSGRLQPKTVHAIAGWATYSSMQVRAWRVSVLPEPSKPPYRLFRSRSISGDYHLDWSEIDHPVDSQPAHNLAVKVCRESRRAG